MYEGEELFEQEFMNVTEDQFNELVDRSAISSTGYWLEDYKIWIILAIGLDQTPGGYEIEVSPEGRLQ